MSSLSIAITIDNSRPLGSVVHGNGIAQNIKFLFDLLVLLGHKPYLLGCNPVDNERLPIGGREYPLIRLTDVVSRDLRTDLVLEVGLAISQSARRELGRRFGARTGCVRYGHTMFMDMEQICHGENLPPGIYVNDPVMVWASPHFANSFSYLETVYSAPVEVAPYIWEPDLVDKPFGKADYREIPDIYVMEPNLSIIKNALIPMAILERLYRSNPDAFGRGVILNGVKFSQQKFFLENIVRHMPSMNSRSNKVFFAKRATFNQVFRKRDVLLGHQHGCELNYLYFEALYRNVPLVHNSPALKEVGYYYPEFRVDLGLQALQRAIADRKVSEYADAAKSFIQRYSIRNPVVQKGYRELIDKTMSVAV